MSSGEVTVNQGILNPWLLEQIAKGEAVLFLGAGAIKGASGDKDKQALTGPQLRDFISDKYLCGGLKERSLSEVAELAKNESSLADVQKTIYDLFSGLHPAECHKLIPTFRWHAIVTTNYDFVAERAYSDCNSPLQKIAAVVGDGDAKDQDWSDPGIVPLLKLHGCLSKINDPKLPLILSSEEYAKHKKNRTRVFGIFSDWAKSHPVIFCGYDISDPNIQQILFDLGDRAINRPIYGVVKPSFTEYELRYWRARRFIPECMKFEKFINQINHEIPKSTRILSTFKSKDSLSIQSKIVRGSVSDSLCSYLEVSLEHVREGMLSNNIDVKDFYRGMGSSWSPIESKLDVDRRITDEILLENVLDIGDDKLPQLVLLKGHAGSGKSVTLRRIAWNAAVDHEAFCVWLTSESQLRIECLREIYNLIDERIFLFIEDVLPYVEEVDSMFRKLRHEQIPVTIFIGARTNEWNILGTDLDVLVRQNYELGKLDINEIKGLINLLQTHSCLGYLEGLTDKKRIDFFKLTAERQLLVALHEALFSGESFENIVVDEYNNIVPPEAKSLYLDVCTFNRFKVGVRAGLISRVSGFNMEYFQKKLFAPLEHLVFTYKDHRSKDYAYRSRHTVIAEIVFNHVLTSPEARADQIIRLVRHMNVDYQSDRLVFQQIVKGRELAKIFEDSNLVARIFGAAGKALVDESYIFHQRAIYELHRQSGRARVALELINDAERLAVSHRIPIRHTKALVLKKLAMESQSASERQKLRSESKTILQQLLKKHESSHAFHAMGLVVLDEIKDYLVQADSENSDVNQLLDRKIAELVRDVEKVIVDGLRSFPRDTYLLELESKLAELIKDKPRALRSLKKAFELNPSSGLIAKRLGKHYRDLGYYGNAKQVLERCLEENPNSTEAHSELGITLIRQDEESNSKQIRYHLNKAFTAGDTNYRTQFWLACHEFLYGDPNRAKDLFESLKQSKMNPREKRDPRHEFIGRDGNPVDYIGRVKLKKENYCFISAPNFSQEIFAHSSSFKNSDWDSISAISELVFNLSFTFSGPVGGNCRMSEVSTNAQIINT